MYVSYVQCVTGCLNETSCPRVDKRPQEGKPNDRCQGHSFLRKVVTPAQRWSKGFCHHHHPSPDSMRQTGEFMEHL